MTRSPVAFLCSLADSGGNGGGWGKATGVEEDDVTWQSRRMPRHPGALLSPFHEEVRCLQTEAGV